MLIILLLVITEGIGEIGLQLSLAILISTILNLNPKLKCDKLNLCLKIFLKVKSPTKLWMDTFSQV